MSAQTVFQLTHTRTHALRFESRVRVQFSIRLISARWTRTRARSLDATTVAGGGRSSVSVRDVFLCVGVTGARTGQTNGNRWRY